MKCDTCGSKDVAAIRVELGDRSSVQLTTCHRCEAKVWTGREGVITLSRVLELASTNRPQ